MAESTQSARTNQTFATTSAQLADELQTASFLEKHLHQSKLIFSGSAEFQAESIFHGMASFIQNVVFKGNVEFASSPTFSQDTAGYVVIQKGQRSVDALYDQEYSTTPIVTVTAVVDVDQDTLDNLDSPESTFTLSKESYILTNTTPKGFTIVLEKPAEKELKFSWIALSIKGAKTQTSTSSPVARPSAQPSPSSSTQRHPQLHRRFQIHLRAQSLHLQNFLR